MRFTLVDEILELDPGHSVRALKTMAPEEELFQDHFPGFPVVPGVLLVEMMAQTAGKCLYAEDSRRGRPMLARINSASFREWVKPGQCSTIFAQILTSRPDFATADCYIEVGNRRVAQSSLLFGFVGNDQFAPGYQDKVMERFLNEQKNRQKAVEPH